MQVFRDLPEIADSPIAVTIGKFDGVHLGHLALIEQLKIAAARLKLPACALIFDPHPAEFFLKEKAPTRLTTLPEKIRLLEAQGLDRLYVCPFTEAIAGMSPEIFLYDVLSERLRVRLLLVGQDFRFGSQRGGDVARLRSLGREVGLEVSTVNGFFVDGVRVSSTSIRQAIARGDTARIRRFLGRDLNQLPPVVARPTLTCSNAFTAKSAGPRAR